MTSFDHDVLIAGAGPAGSHAAYLLARAGMRVALLDRARFPRDKVCGGGLSAKTLALLDADPGAVVHKSFTGAWIAWRGRRAFAKDLGRPAGCTVARSEFDHWLVRRAQAAGAQFHPHTAVRGVTQGARGTQIDTTRGAFQARIVLAADGVASMLRAQLFGRRVVTVAPAVEALVYCSEEGLRRLGERVLFDLGGMPRGYGWIFPKRDHLNAGVYSIFGGAGIRKHLQAFLRCHGLPADGHDPLARSRLACDWFAALITGELSYRACFWRTLAGSPAWLLSPRHGLRPGSEWHPAV